MRPLFLALGLALASCGGAFADAASDCNQDKDRDLSIRSCTVIIEGRARGDKAAAYGWRGVNSYTNGDYDHAIADLGQVLRLKPQDGSSYYWRGLAYFQKGEYDRAIADEDQAIRLKPQINPQHADAYFRRAQAYYKKGDYDRAIADFGQTLRLKPEFAAAYYWRAAAYYRKGDYGRAIAEDDQAIRLDPNFAAAFSARGDAYYNQGDYDRAIADEDQAIRLTPQNADAYLVRGQAYYKKDDYDRAIADYNEALRLKPYNGEAAKNRDIALAKIKEIAESRLGANAPEGPKAPPRNPVSMGRRVALVIGNAAYKAVEQLANPRNDAGAVAAELTRVGFDVIERYDLGIVAMRRALGEVEDKAAGADWALVYYSGHGMELNGQNWLIPVDAQLARANDVPDEAVALERVLDRVRIASKMRIVILDACRNNPYRSRMAMGSFATRAVERGFAPVEPAHGEVVFYAARDGSVALDGKGTNSPFAAALVKHMDEDGIELGRFFRRVTSSVLAATGNRQEPTVYGSIPDEDFYFKPAR